MKRRISTVICAVCLFLSVTLALASCNGGAAGGIADAEINENGELILVYDDGREQNLGVVVGEEGKDGADGSDGQNGRFFPCDP